MISRALERHKLRDPSLLTTKLIMRIPKSTHNFFASRRRTLHGLRIPYRDTYAMKHEKIEVEVSEVQGVISVSPYQFDGSYCSWFVIPVLSCPVLSCPILSGIPRWLLSAQVANTYIIPVLKAKNGAAGWRSSFMWRGPLLRHGYDQLRIVSCGHLLIGAFI
jgi:hypothetical protein